MMDLRIGDVVNLTSMQTLIGKKGEWLRFTFKAKKDRQFVLLFLGDEGKYGDPPLDPIKRLYELGWSHPDLKPGDDVSFAIAERVSA